MTPPGLLAILREWGRIGVLGFGGPPVHIAMLRERVVERFRWMPRGELRRLVIIPLMQGTPSTPMAG